MNITPITKNQAMKILTAMVYSFSSSFFVTLMTQGGITGEWEIDRPILFSATIAGFNGLFYGISKLFEDENKNGTQTPPKSQKR